MEIKVFGPGCAKCAQAEQLVKDVVEEKGLAVTVTKVSDIKEMMTAGILSTPAVALDGVVKCTGRVPSKAEVAAWIDGAAAAESGTSAGCCKCGGK